jgi:hypothetical protein
MKSVDKRCSLRLLDEVLFELSVVEHAINIDIKPIKTILCSMCTPSINGKFYKDIISFMGIIRY